MSHLLAYAAAWLATALLSLVLVRCCIGLAPRLGLVDIPQHEAHKNHRKSTPVLGGAGMLLAWLLSVGAGLLLAVLCPNLPVDGFYGLRAGIPAVIHLLGIIVSGAIIVTCLGIADDRRPMSALLKFLGQAFVAALTASAGMRVSFLHTLPGANTVFTILWIMTLMNAMNFFDNMDGLAAGTAVIAAFFFMFTAALRGQFFVAMLSATTGGAACGFLFYNAPPARIFMGDGGSHFLGYLLSVLGIMTTYYVPSENPTPATLLIPLFILGVPLFDACAVIVIRLRLGVPIYKGDNRHISHRFARLGLGRPRAVLLVLLLCFIVGGSGLTLLWLPPAGALLELAIVAAIFTLISIIQFHSQESNGDDTR